MGQCQQTAHYSANIFKTIRLRRKTPFCPLFIPFFALLVKSVEVYAHLKKQTSSAFVQCFLSLCIYALMFLKIKKSRFPSGFFSRFHTRTVDF
jgi:hypothetical protein